MSQKDFLSQFSETNKKPDSFKEEVRVKVQKEKKPINKFALIIVLTILLAIAILCYFLFLAPKIEMPNFVGKTKSDVAAFVKQQGIETSGIIFEEEYDFDNAEGVILTQSVEAGKKVKEDVKITFKASLGPDPDELIKVPDLESMDKTEIKEWIDDNKLTKTKITTSFSDAVEADQVISFAFSGCDEDTFTRNSTLKISISKGPAPAGSVTMEDFTKKSYEYVESWATSKKVKVSKVETYSDSVEKGLVINQSLASGKSLKEGETFTVTVSKGKSVVMIDLTDKTQTEITKWCTTNGITQYTTTAYSSTKKDSCISFSPKAGTILTTGDSIDVVISLGDPETPTTFTTYEELKAWVDSVNEQGADLTLHNDGNQFHDTVAVGKLITYETYNECGDTVHYSISNGRNIYINKDFGYTKNVTKESDIRTVLENYELTYEVVYKAGKASDNNVINTIMDMYYYNGSTIVDKFADTYVGQNATIYVVICDKLISE